MLSLGIPPENAALTTPEKKEPAGSPAISAAPMLLHCVTASSLTGNFPAI